MLDTKNIPNVCICINNKVLQTYALRSLDLLESITAASYYYSSTEQKVVSMVKSILKNHPFVDGNKRTGVILLIFLTRRLDLHLKATDADLFQIIVEVAADKDNKFSVERLVKKLFK